MDSEDTKNTQLTHIDDAGNPRMVDVGDKQVTQRMAHARSIVVLPPIVLQELTQTASGQSELYTKKGPVFHTAIIAGTMAVKKTSEIIPFCHPLAINGCKINIYLNEAQEAVIDCTVKVTGKTGVEMEALTGASAAALAIYDMCKALSHHIIIKDTRLMEKTGGKRDFKYTEQ